jgi:uncharacterized protein YbaP (TraB family)
MKLSFINESIDITGKLDQLINKFEKLRTTDSENNLNYKLIIEILEQITTLEDLKKQIKLMASNLKDERTELIKLKSKLDPEANFQKETYNNRYESFKKSMDIYNSIIEYGKIMKWWN